MGKRIYLNDDWHFSTSFSEELHKTEPQIEDLQNVRLPHTTVETPFHYFDEGTYQKISGYRRVLKAEDGWQGKHVFLTVEAAGHASEVYINGKRICEHHCGYTAYVVDLAEHLLWNQENVLVIKVDSRENLNQPPFGNVIDYMTYGGLYREVYLEIKEQSYIADTFHKTVTVETEDGIGGCVTVVSEVKVEQDVDTALTQTLYDGEMKLIQQFPVGELSHTLKDVKLWSPEHPALYYIKTVLSKGDTILDECVDRIGFRTIDFKADGLYLNGRKYKFRGLNRHQSYPYVGYAMPKSMQRMDAEILKHELGLNAVRTSHYPQSHYFLEACDELGLLVFTEIPGWQHIGDEAWKAQSVKNTEDMVMQYHNHPSIFLWGVRINESLDDDEFYTRTNEAAHRLDDTRPTSGVRYLQKSSLLEDVYAYNDFSHDGTNEGAMKKAAVTTDVSKGYFVSEYNGHMFPTKTFDAEDHRVEHMLRHAKVMDGYFGQEDVAGGFGWCMFDYNTHKDFGSGDRICYHGVLDMFRNPKLAAAVYASQKDAECAGDVVLEISSSMDIGEHPACLMKDVYAITNADSVRVYKNDLFVGEHTVAKSPYKSLPHGPILIDDFIGDLMEKGEGFSHRKAQDVKKILMAANKYGLAHLPVNIMLLAAKCMVFRGMKMSDAVGLYNKYVGNWGGTFTTYRFEGVKDGKVVKTVIKRPMTQVSVVAEASHQVLTEESTYDVAAIRIKAVGDTGDVLPFYQEPIQLEVSGNLELIGPSMIPLRGGMGGTYVKTIGEYGEGTLRIKGEGIKTIELRFEIRKEV